MLAVAMAWAASLRRDMAHPTYGMACRVYGRLHGHCWCCSEVVAGPGKRKVLEVGAGCSAAQYKRLVLYVPCI